MGAKQRSVTKNTFIDFDTRYLDESAKDSRQNKSWGGPSTTLDSSSTTLNSSNCIDDFDQSENEEFTDLDDDWVLDEINRLKTMDPMDAAQNWNSSEKIQLDTASMFEDPARPTTVPGRVCTSPVQPAMLLVQIPVPMPVMGVANPPTMLWKPGMEMAMATEKRALVEQPQMETYAEPPESRNKDTQTRKGIQAQRKESSDVTWDGKSTWTCRMVRNLPNDYTRQDLLELLDAKKLQFDFVYLPVDWGKRSNLGYAFVNLVNHEEAIRIEKSLNGFCQWKVPSDKICEVAWGKAEQQSLKRIVERLRNSPVMHPDVPEHYKPLLFTLGQRAVFPAPTKRIRPPPTTSRVKSETFRAR